jgi:hypothetical protein
MPTSDPWFDWLLDFGSLDGFSPLPPEFASIDPLAGRNVDDWQGSDGNIRPVLDPLPPLPANASQCARDFYDDLVQALGQAWNYARRYCSYCQLRLWLNPFGSWQAPLTYLGFLIACGDNSGANWADPCASGGIGIPQDCEYLSDWFAGFFKRNCPERELTTDFSPAVHRLVSEILAPTGRAFLWRLAYDQPVLWPLVFNAEILTENNACKSYALGILLQIEALQELINQVSTETCYVRFERYFDGILEGRRYVVTDENGVLVGDGLIGYNRTLELGFCLGEQLFRNDVGRVACEDEDEEMGCTCDEVRAIVRDEIDRIVSDYLNPIKTVTDWLDALFRPLEQALRNFFVGDSDTSWDGFLSRYSRLSAYLRPSETSEEEVILPTLTDRIEEGFDRIRDRQRIIYSCVNGLIRATVRVSLTGNKITSSDTWIQPAALRPYNHYGQLWLVYQVGNQVRRTAWQWIRSRDHELSFTVPDIRASSADTVQVSAEYQLFAGLQMQSGYPTVKVLVPELAPNDLWLGGQMD